MKVFIDGKVVKCDSITVVYEDELFGMNDQDQEVYGELHIILNSEGVITDLIEDGSDDVDQTMCYEPYDLIEQCI